MTIGIYGEWGSGKTSFLMMLDKALQEKGIFPIWFNAWKYSQEDNLWSALLQTILNHARVSGSRLRIAWVKLKIWWDNISLRSGMWEATRKIVPVIIRLALFVLCALIFLGWGATKIEDSIKKIPINFFQSYP
jgi:hypothetical protein